MPRKHIDDELKAKSKTFSVTPEIVKQLRDLQDYYKQGISDVIRLAIRKLHEDIHK
jgi:hypothetical protein